MPKEMSPDLTLQMTIESRSDSLSSLIKGWQQHGSRHSKTRANLALPGNTTLAGSQQTSRSDMHAQIMSYSETASSVAKLAAHNERLVEYVQTATGFKCNNMSYYNACMDNPPGHHID